MINNVHFLFIIFMITGVSTTSCLQPKQNLTIVVIATFTKDFVVSSVNHLLNQQNIQCIVLQIIFHDHRLSSNKLCAVQAGPR